MALARKRPSWSLTVSFGHQIMVRRLQLGVRCRQEALGDHRTVAFGFGGKAASVMVPRKRSIASLSARSSFASGGT